MSYLRTYDSWMKQLTYIRRAQCSRCGQKYIIDNRGKDLITFDCDDYHTQAYFSVAPNGDYIRYKSRCCKTLLLRTRMILGEPFQLIE